jgi:DNA-directed RNA polymerase subunit K/omega
MIQPPPGMSAFQFVTLASLRAAQLQRGCLPRVDGDGTHKATVIAQVEVAEGRVTQRSNVVAPAGEPSEATLELPQLVLQLV